MDKWEHLFYGEFAKRRTLLSGLTLEQVSQVPPNMSHSIFAELWHLELWQRILVTRDEALFDETWQQGKRYPETGPQRLEDWEALVEAFFAGVNLALEWTRSPEKLNLETDPGMTMADVLRGLAVHNAYHFGKIVALRQMMGAWPD